MTQTSARVLRLLSMLQARRQWSGADLADRLGVSARTLRRDVERLRELGYPLRARPGTGGGYELAAGAALPPLGLDEEEAVALTAGLLAALPGGTVPGSTFRPGGVQAQRHAEPHGLVLLGQCWYLVAWDLDRQDWRSFRVDRMRPPQRADGHFAPRPVPGPDPAAFVRVSIDALLAR